MPVYRDGVMNGVTEVVGAEGSLAAVFSDLVSCTDATISYCYLVDTAYGTTVFISERKCNIQKSSKFEIDRAFFLIVC